MKTVEVESLKNFKSTTATDENLVEQLLQEAKEEAEKRANDI